MQLKKKKKTTELAGPSEEYSICNTENTQILYLLRLLFNIYYAILQQGVVRYSPIGWSTYCD